MKLFYKILLSFVLSPFFSIAQEDATAKEMKFQFTMSQAVAYYNYGQYSKSKKLFIKASRLKPNDESLASKIRDWDNGKKDSLKKEKKFQLTMDLASAYWYYRDYSGAKKLFIKASKLNPKYPDIDQKIQICDRDKLLMKGENKREKEYASKIRSADKTFKRNEYQKAKMYYQAASALKASEQYPKDKISECDLLLSKKK